MAYLLGGAVAVGSALAFLKDGNIARLSGLLFGLAFPIFGTVVLLSFRRLARLNEREILDGLKAKFGEPFVEPE